MTPDLPAKTRLPWLLLFLLALVALAGISALRDATTGLASLAQVSGPVAESSVSRSSGSPSSYTLRLGLQGQPQRFGLNLRDDADAARTLQQRLPVGAAATLYYRKPVLLAGRAVCAVWQLESQGTVLYALSETHRQAWKKPVLVAVVLGIGAALLLYLRTVRRRTA